MAAHQNTTPIEYRDIPDHPGYRVGDDGSVWSCWERIHQKGRNGLLSIQTDAWRQLKPYLNSNGRLSLALTHDGVISTRSVYRLVMLAFVGPCPPGMVVCHWNGDAADNRLSNLRYDTWSGNEADKERHGRKPVGSQKPGAKLDADRVEAIRALLASGVAVKRIAEQFNVSRKLISNIRDGRTWKCIGQGGPA